jgi:prepilin-type N-terminal cleavage/methylation domain-containing protein/prepilin-type processing-associated H-X9-DG protein
MGLLRGRAFSLIELLVVVAILAILCGPVSAAVQRVRAAAVRAQCESHLAAIGLALHHYHDVEHRFPPGMSYRGGSAAYPFMSWNTRLLPFLEQDALWRQTIGAFAEDPRFLHNPPHVGLATVMPAFSCPADTRTLMAGKYAAFTAYLGVEGEDLFGEDGVLFRDSEVRLADITDGTSNTVVVGERPPSADEVLGWWYAGEGQAMKGSADMVLGVQELNVGSLWGRGCPRGPYAFAPGRVSNQCDAFHFWSLHPGGANFLFGDGTVRFLSYSAAPLMPALATRAGGEVVPLPW